MKPILFNTDMVRAILDNRKTVARRVVKPPLRSECDHGGQHEFIRDNFIEGTDFTGFVCKKCGYGVCGPHFKFRVGSSWIRPPYRPGDILYVRETFCRQPSEEYPFVYKASVETSAAWQWRPSIHMPREAARIFLRVTDVRVERLQEITHGGIEKEGVVTVGTPGSPDRINPFFTFKNLWESTIKSADRPLYGWEANPWVWVIEFERVSRKEVRYGKTS